MSNTTYAEAVTTVTSMFESGFLKPKINLVERFCLKTFGFEIGATATECAIESMLKTGMTTDQIAKS